MCGTLNSLCLRKSASKFLRIAMAVLAVAIHGCVALDIRVPSLLKTPGTREKINKYIASHHEYK